jgi:ribosomal protein L11 methyltransferase
MIPRHTIALTIPAAASDLFTAALGPFAESLTLFEADPDGVEWQVGGVLAQHYDKPALQSALSIAALAAGIPEPAVSIEPLADIDWLSRVALDFPPVTFGRFFLHGSHYTPRPGEGRIRLRVDAGTAFGSGEHATTQGCLQGIEWLHKRRRIATVLDMGCGSGILGIAAAKLWRCGVIAIDIDPEAVRVTRENARLNGVARLVRAAAGDGYRSPILHNAPPFELIVSNILARPLRKMAKDLAQNLAPGGQAILSGLLQSQERSVLAAHATFGLRLAARFPIGDWVALVLQS